MAMRWMALDEWKAKLAKGVRPLETAVRKAVVPDVEVPDGAGDARVVKFVLSDGRVDRDRDVVSPAGWELDNYRKNPQVLWAHDYSQLPLGKAVSVAVEGNRLVATAEFMPKDLNPMSDTVYRMLKGGWLKAVSVGFKPTDAQYNAERKGVDFHRQELMEVSVVPIPSNPGALAEAKAAGVDVAPLARWATATLLAYKKAFPGAPNADLASPAPVDAFRDNAGCPLGELCPKLKGQPCDAAEACPLGKGAGAPETKQGRVLSATNERGLRDAIAALQAVLDQLPGVKVTVEGGEGGEVVTAAAPSADLIAKHVVERDGKWCVTTADYARTLGCHPTKEEAVRQLAAVEANKHRAVDVVLTRKQVAELCPSCADKMAALNLAALKLTPEVLAKAPEMSMKLCESFGDDPGFFTKCRDHVSGWDLKDPDGFCAKLHEMCTGRWPAQDREGGKKAADAAAAVDALFELEDEPAPATDEGALTFDVSEDDLRAAVKAAVGGLAQDFAAQRDRIARGRVD